VMCAAAVRADREGFGECSHDTAGYPCMTTARLARARPVFASPPCDVVCCRTEVLSSAARLRRRPIPPGCSSARRARKAASRARALSGIRSRRHRRRAHLRQAYDLAQRVGKTFLELGATQERPIALVRRQLNYALPLQFWVLCGGRAGRADLAGLFGSFRRISANCATC